jgi:hypothetical protein
MRAKVACHHFATIHRRRALLPLAGAHLRLLKCLRTHTKEYAMKVLAQFSYAAFLAAAIGVAVGGTAFSFVWLLHILKI